jgi:hypothetical protein
VICRAHLASIRHSTSLPVVSGHQRTDEQYGIGNVTIHNPAPIDVIQNTDNIVTSMLESHDIVIKSQWFPPQ